MTYPNPARVLLLLTLAGALTGPLAGDALVGDRPDFTDGPLTMAAGRWQLEGGATTTHADGDSAVEAGELLLRVGLVDGLELRLSPGSWVDEPGARGRGDAAIGIKARLFESAGGALPAVSLLATAGLPTGEEGAGSDEIEPEVKVSLAWELSDRVGLSANLGVARPSEDGERFAQGLASASLGVSLTARWGAYVEVYGVLPTARHGDDAAYSDAGVTWLANDDLQLDIRVGRQLNGEQPETYLGAGVAVRW
jgi:hypothetical protein